MAAAPHSRPLKAATLENTDISQHLSPTEIDALFDYYRQIGLCPQLVDRAVTFINVLRHTDEPFLSFETAHPQVAETA